MVWGVMLNLIFAPNSRISNCSTVENNQPVSNVDEDDANAFVKLVCILGEQGGCIDSGQCA